MSEPLAAIAMLGLTFGVLVAIHRFCKRYIGVSLLQAIGVAAFLNWLSGP